MQVKKCRILIVLDMIADMVSNKNVQPIETELFIRGRKVTFLLFHYTILLCCAKHIKLYSTHYFTMKIPNKRYNSFNKLQLFIHQILTLRTL